MIAALFIPNNKVISLACSVTMPKCRKKEKKLLKGHYQGACITLKGLGLLNGSFGNI